MTGLLQNFQAVCLAIEYAHSKGVLHCDIKPDNIMIGDYGEVFVVDWGLVVVCGDVKSPSEIHQMETLDPGIIPPYKPSELASSGLHEQQGGSRRGVGGTPAYMAPEQFTATMSEDISLVTPKADIYALGSTLYHILTGKAPHLPKEGIKESPDAFYFRITTGMIPPPREKDASIPKLLEQIVLKAMQVKPEDRYASARELAEDIKRYVSDEPVHAYQESRLEKARRWIRKNRALVGAAMVMLLLVAMVAIGFVIMFAQFNKELIIERDRANSNEKLAKDNEELAQQKLADIKKSQEESEAYKLKIIQVANELEMVLIPAGKFMMGSPASEKGRDNGETQHEVTITKPFYMGKYEVTQEQWKGIMGNNPSFIKGAKLPVTNVSWLDCQEFIKNLNANTNGGYRLPSEAEWEYACRAGASTAYSFGDSLTPNDANYAASKIGEPKAVGSYKPNALGLYDMHGNVWEWCEDWFYDYPAGAITDPKGPATGTDRMLRGGCFGSIESLIRSSSRNWDSPTYRYRFGGIRLARMGDIKTDVAPATKPDPLKVIPSVGNLLVAPFSEIKAKEIQKEVAKILKKEVEAKTDLGNGLNLEMILIPAGKFKMGSPASEKGHKNFEAQYEVTITKPYYIGKHEVTQEQWEAVMDNNPSIMKGPKLPVTNVSWEDCQGFIKKLNAKTDGGYRLPTEAEWEYACRAGTTTAYSFGDKITPKDANYWVSKAGKPVVVGSYKPNEFGLYDMHGNVWEWCGDWYGGYPFSAIDPIGSGPAIATERVMRGGSFDYVVLEARSSNRGISSPTYKYGNSGFRLAKTP